MVEIYSLIAKVGKAGLKLPVLAGVLLQTERLVPVTAF